MGLTARIFGIDPPKSYYEAQKSQWELPTEVTVTLYNHHHHHIHKCVISQVQRIERADGGCVRVTDLNKRSFIGVSFINNKNIFLKMICCFSGSRVVSESSQAQLLSSP